jgi:DNA polymerase epsilon subunit 2
MNVTWATNPCRIRNPRSGREIVVFRYDLLHFFQRQQLFLPRGGGAGDSSRHRGGSGDDHGDDDDAMRDEGDDNGGGRRDVPLHVRLIKTVLGQAHLLPASGVPVAWNYDHALGLYPLPSLLVLGGDGPGSEEGGGGTTRYHEVCEGCRVLHPGSATAGSFAVYRDGGGNGEEDGDEDDNNDDDDSDCGSGPRVEFGNLGVEK